jgi:class 3 adenylate cyclase
MESNPIEGRQIKFLRPTASDRLDFTVAGPAVNEASRIQALCRPLERNILISSTF